VSDVSSGSGLPQSRQPAELRTSPVPASAPRRAVVILLKLLLGVAIVVGLGSYAGLDRALDSVKSARIGPLWIAGALGFLSVIGAAAGVAVLGRAVQPSLPWLVALRGSLLAWGTGFFFGRLSEFLLPVFWRRHVSMSDAAAVVLVDKIVSLVWTLAIAVVGLGLLFDWRAAAFTATAGFGGMVVAAICSASPVAHRLSGRVLPVFLQRSLDQVRRAVRTLAVCGRWAVAVNFALTGVRSFLHGALLVALMTAVGQTIAVTTGACIQAMVSLASLLPGTLMGLGYWETVYVAALGRVGVEPGDALAASLLWRVVSLVLTGVVLLLGWGEGRSGPGRQPPASPDPADHTSLVRRL
jgi:uncharacterized membrane protein YbhN (UPF0104 family)